MGINMLSIKEVEQVLSNIPDPEIPVINISELGVLREVKKEGNIIKVIITPTYSGCPAMNQIEVDIKKKLKEIGVKDFFIETIYKPAWTTDWMTEKAKKKLLDYGISPPEKTSIDKRAITGEHKKVICPLCKTHDTKLISQFGSTACKALYQCRKCLEPFDYFKCI